ncbi:MAG: hypothetical protein R3F17_15110 [Planctomycetota bacterium]
MGERQAAKWNLRKGDTLELATATIDQETGLFGQAANITVVLAGTYRSTFNELDLSRIYMRREALGDWLGRPGEFSQVALRLEDYEQDAKASVPRVREDLIEKGLLHKPREHGASFAWEVQTWEQSRKAMLSAIENERALLGIMLGLVLLVAGSSACSRSLDDGHGKAPRHRHPVRPGRDPWRDPDPVPVDRRA